MRHNSEQDLPELPSQPKLKGNMSFDRGIQNITNTQRSRSKTRLQFGFDVENLSRLQSPKSTEPNKKGKTIMQMLSLKNVKNVGMKLLSPLKKIKSLIPEPEKVQK